MIDFKVKLLGVGSASPKPDRFQPAQVVKFNNSYYLIDCGEGTQIQCKRFRVPLQKIDRIFISHMHADHYLGLPGIIYTMDMLGKKGDIHVHAPEELREWLSLSFELNAKNRGLRIVFHPNPKSAETIFESKRLSVKAFPLDHKVHTCGFRFQEKPLLRHLRPEKLERYKIPNHMRNSLKEGADFKTIEGEVIPNSVLTTDADIPRSYAYVSDTRFFNPVIEQVKDVTCMYHETTFLHSEVLRARKTFHSTALQAAQLAKEANVGKLLMGHYSARYIDVSAFEEEAQSVFKNAVACEDGHEEVLTY